MKRLVFAIILTAILGVWGVQEHAYAQGPNKKSFGFGLQLGEPTALTFRLWTSASNSWDFGIGQSYLGSPHLYGGYLWHFRDAFNSRIVFLYAGVGAALGINDGSDHHIFIKRNGKDYWYYSDENSTVLAARGAFGINIIPNRTPLDIFLEIDPILGLTPDVGLDFQASVGIRFYP